MLPLDLSEYAHGEVPFTDDQIVDPNQFLRDLHKVPCCALAESFCNKTFHYARGFMTDHFTAAVSPAGVTYATAIHHANGKMVLKDECSMVIFDVRH